MKGLAVYRSLSTLPGFPSTAAVAAVAKLQSGVFSLSLLLTVAHYRTVGEAGIVSAASAAGGLAAPVRGFLADRHGYRPVLHAALALYLACLVGVIGNEHRHGPLTITVLGALAAAVTAPPVGIATRMTLRSLAPPALRPNMMSFDATLTDVGFIAGPLVASAVHTAIAPWAGVATAAVLTAVATLLTARSVHLPAPAGPVERGGRARRPLSHHGLRRVLACALLFFTGVRAIEVAFPSWGAEHGSAALGGVLLSVMAVGSVAGGLVMSGLPHRLSNTITLAVTLAVLAAATCLMAFASHLGPTVVLPAAALVGVGLAPTFATLYGTAAALAPAGGQAETQSWITAFMHAGGAAGTAAAGLLSDAHAAWAAMAFGATVFASAAAATPRRAPPSARRQALS
ncbi:MFS transporter [Kitasatospora sp. NPDC088346]|uniref:MFS transporter n=1 Tax=Kitasatospora sp. NPDC088346 TaxID=3364073 RepID=UPI0037F8BAB4